MIKTDAVPFLCIYFGRKAFEKSHPPKERTREALPRLSPNILFCKAN